MFEKGLFLLEIACSFQNCAQIYKTKSRSWYFDIFCPAHVILMGYENCTSIWHNMLHCYTTQCNVFLLISYAELALVHYKKTHFGLFCTWKSWFLIFFWFSPWAQSSLKVCQKKRHLQILWRYPLFLMCNSSIHSKATLHTRICHLGHF